MTDSAGQIVKTAARTFTAVVTKDVSAVLVITLRYTG